MCDHDKSSLLNTKFILESSYNWLFVIVWIKDFSTIAYCKYNYFDKENKYTEIIIKKHDLNLVKIYDQKAIIIPTTTACTFST